MIRCVQFENLHFNYFLAYVCSLRSICFNWKRKQFENQTIIFFFFCTIFCYFRVRVFDRHLKYFFDIHFRECNRSAHVIMFHHETLSCTRLKRVLFIAICCFNWTLARQSIFDKSQITLMAKTASKRTNERIRAKSNVFFFFVNSMRPKKTHHLWHQPSNMK